MTSLPAGIRTQEYLIGGVILQEIDPAAATMRLCYFHSRGVITDIHHDLHVKDLIQFCPEHLLIIMSRENLFYSAYTADDKEEFDILIKELKAVVVATRT